MKKEKGKVAVGMSGGVDSSVAAAILSKKGYRVQGVYMDAWEEEGCEVDEERLDALRVAKKLGIPFKVLDVKEEYKRKVVDYFYETYERGLTPNPDVLCNSEIKFGIFYEWAKSKGFSQIATGHYCRKVKIRDLKSEILNKSQIRSPKFKNVYLLQRGKDKKKDQSYFLWKVGGEILENVLFPLGDKKKDWVRRKAGELELGVEDKPDSMGVCFIGDVDVSELLEEKPGKNPGEVEFRGEAPTASRRGQVVGEHRGLWFYTVGQRGGFEVEKKKLEKLGVDPTGMAPLYVVGKKIKENRLVVGFREEGEKTRLSLGDLHWLLGGFEERLEKEVGRGRVFVRIRNLGDLVRVVGVDLSGRKLEVRLEEKVFGVAGGQSGVLYWRKGEKGEELVLGGGVLK